MKELVQKIITLKVNGKDYDITVGTGRNDMPESETLAHTLRDRLGLTGLKIGCDQGACGCCTVIMDGKAVTACLVPAPAVDGRNVVTIEGVGCDGKLDPVQEAVLENHALQCGFCTPGFIMSAKALLDENPDATREEIRRAISGNLCRCTGYENIVNAVEKVNKENMTAEGK